jgi:aspartoacylase
LQCDFSVVSEFTRSPDAQSQVKVSHLIKYLGERLVRRVAIVGGTHGNERIGVELVRQWNKQPSLVSRSSFQAVHCLIGNPRAVTANVRFIDADLNRQFAVTDEVKDTTQYEVGRAAELRDWFQQQRIDFVIDLHSSNSNVGQVIMMADAENDVCATRLVHSLVAEFGADTLRVANFEGTKKQAWSLDAVAPAGMSVEIGPLPHGTVTSTILESSRRLVMRALDLLHQRNEELLQFSVATNPFACADIIPVAAAPSLIRMPDHRPQLPVFVSRSIVKFPAADDEASADQPLLAVVAPALEGCNFQPLNHGDAAFVAADGSGAVWPLVDPRPEGKRDGPLYTLFVNGSFVESSVHLDANFYSFQHSYGTESAYQSKRIAFIAYERKEIFVF